MKKRYVVVMGVMVIVCVLVWKLSGSYALYTEGYVGNNIVAGTDWALNISKISEPVLEGDAILTKEISSIGTTLSFEVSLPKPNSRLSFDFDIENMGRLDAELYALTLTGLSSVQSEYINYTITPLDYVTVKTENEVGSILAKREKHSYHITVSYQDSINENNIQENILNLSSTIVYGQK